MRAFLIGLSVAAAFGCASAPPPPSPPSPPRVAPAPRIPWARFAEVSTWPASGAAFVNLGHHGTGTLARVRVSPEARAAYEALVMDSVLPDGSVVALFHENAAGNGPVFVMEKRHATWTYIALAPDGVVEKPLSNCAGCHAAAVGDSLFGLPRSQKGAP